MEEKEKLQKELELIRSSRKEQETLNDLNNEIDTEKRKMFNVKHNNLNNITNSLSKGLLSAGKGILTILDKITKPSVKGTSDKKKSEWGLPNQDDINKMI